PSGPSRPSGRLGHPTAFSLIEGLADPRLTDAPAFRSATPAAWFIPFVLGYTDPWSVRRLFLPRARAMSEVTQILSAIEQGDSGASEKLLPLVYDELRKLAAQKLAHEKPGQTLQATALVHEAYLRLVGNDGARRWDSRGHFFAAAAEAMRRILVENYRRKNRAKRGGDQNRGHDEDAIPSVAPPVSAPLALPDPHEAHATVT